MIEALVGNGTVEKVLFFLFTYSDGYAKQMADVFGLRISGIQQQLRRLEDGGVVVSRLVGRTRVYSFNPRCYFRAELMQLLDKAMSTLPPRELEKCYRRRTRPRHTGKP